MARVKRGVTKHRRHAKVLAQTKGHRGVRHRLYRQAKESLVKALAYSYAHRRERKGDFRRLWILRSPVTVMYPCHSELAARPPKCPYPPESLSLTAPTSIC